MQVGRNRDVDTGKNTLGPDHGNLHAGSAQSLATAPEGLYVPFDLGALALVDPSTRSVRQSMRLDSQDFVASPTAAFGSIWYPTSGGDSIVKLKPLAAAA